MEPSISQSFKKDLAIIRPGLFVVWNSLLERFQVMYRDARTQKIKVVCTVENKDGTYRDCDMRTIIFLANNVAWDLIDQYPDTSDLYHYLKKNKETKKLKDQINHRDKIKQWNKDHRKEWKSAIENAQRGIFHAPERPRERKIIIT